MILAHAEWLLFAWVFGNQAGVPIPVVPALLGAGLEVAEDRRDDVAARVDAGVGDRPEAAGVAVSERAATVGAAVVLRLGTAVGRVSPGAQILVRRVWNVYAAHVRAFHLGARFLPELNAITAGMAGATKLSIIRFVCYGVPSALTWAGLWIGLGYVLSHAVTGTAALLGIRVVVFFLAAFGLYLLFQRVRRYRMIRAFRQGSMSPSVPEAASAPPHPRITAGEPEGRFGRIPCKYL